MAASRDGDKPDGEAETRQLGLPGMEARSKEEVLEAKWPGKRDHLATSWDQVPRSVRNNARVTDDGSVQQTLSDAGEASLGERVHGPRKRDSKSNERYCKFCAARITIGADSGEEFGHVRRFERRKFGHWFRECPYAIEISEDGHERW